MVGDLGVGAGGLGTAAGVFILVLLVLVRWVHGRAVSTRASRPQHMKLVLSAS